MWIFLLLGCAHPVGPAAAVPPRLPAPVVDGALDPARWLVGATTTPERSAQEAWFDGGVALLGVGLHGGPDGTTEWELQVIEPTPEGLVFHAHPGGGRSVDFGAVPGTGGALVFENPARDFPQRIQYQRGADGRTAGIGLAGQPPDQRGDLVTWEPEGEMPDRGARAKGPDGVREVMGPFYAAGNRLDWEPASAGLAPAGDVGWTFGHSALTGADGSLRARGAYVTLWRRQADGSWRIVLDTSAWGPAAS